MNTPAAPAGRRPGSLPLFETSTALHKAAPAAAASSVSQRCSAAAWNWCDFFVRKKIKISREKVKKFPDENE
jgi:hypothetical protein